MPTIETVRGAVDAASLGRTLAHEHVFIVAPETLANFNHHWGAAWWDEDDGVRDGIAKLQTVVDAGITALVDPTGIGMGRDVRRLQRVNESVDLHFVVCTGVYAFLELPTFLKYRSSDDLAALFVRELREGIDDTGVKAAFIKCAVEEHGIIGDVPTILAACAAASIETGAPVMVHTNAAARTGLPALETLTAAGVEPSRIVIAHAGDSNDLDYLRRIADTGAVLGFDRFNIPAFNSDADRMRTLISMLAEGYLQQIHLSHDTACFYDFMIGNPIFAGAELDYLHIANAILPALLEQGVSQEQIDEMMIANPRRFFASA